MDFLAGVITGALVVVAVPKAFDLASAAWAKIQSKIGK